MIDVSPDTADLYLDPSSSLHDELAKEGVAGKIFRKLEKSSRI